MSFESYAKVRRYLTKPGYLKAAGVEQRALDDLHAAAIHDGRPFGAPILGVPSKVAATSRDLHRFVATQVKRVEGRICPEDIDDNRSRRVVQPIVGKIQVL